MEKEKNAIERHNFNPYTVFEDILAGRLPAEFVYRDELVSAFLDIQPITEGHILVVPNEKASCLLELKAQTGERMFRVAQRISKAILASTLKSEGINLFLADGKAAGQTVFHLHLHVFPRNKEDGFGWKLPESYYTPPNSASLRANCLAIKKEMQ
ncbi:MAG: HIT domain-containing protein [Pseudomonadota bacterium]|nr:HIT domain-containing protein [Pseudomonadota bacterium]